MNHPILILILAMTSNSSAFAGEPWELGCDERAIRTSGVEARFSEGPQAKTLTVTQTDVSQYAWVSLPAPAAGWELGHAEFVQATIGNVGEENVDVMLWLVPDKGWDAIGKSISVNAGDRIAVKCDVRATFKDKTQKLNPKRISQVELMLLNAPVGATIEVTGLKATGTAPDWVMPAGRLEVPDMEDSAAAAGKRVRYQLSDAADTELYSALYLPKSWQPNKKYPVIVEFPGNIFFTQYCYSTGLPQQCAIGYGMSRDVESIWVSMPFVDEGLRKIATDG